MFVSFKDQEHAHQNGLMPRSRQSAENQRAFSFSQASDTEPGSLANVFRGSLASESQDDFQTPYPQRSSQQDDPLLSQMTFKDTETLCFPKPKLSEGEDRVEDFRVMFEKQRNSSARSELSIRSETARIMSNAKSVPEPSDGQPNFEKDFKKQVLNFENELSQKSIEQASKKKLKAGIQKGQCNQPVLEHSDEDKSQSENFNIYDDPDSRASRGQDNSLVFSEESFNPLNELPQPSLFANHNEVVTEQDLLEPDDVQTFQSLKNLQAEPHEEPIFDQLHPNSGLQLEGAVRRPTADFAGFALNSWRRS